MTIATLNSLSSYHLSLRHSLQACQTGLLPGKQPCAHLPSCHQRKDSVAQSWGFSSLRPAVPPRKMSGQTQFAHYTATTELLYFLLFPLSCSICFSNLALPYMGHRLANAMVTRQVPLEVMCVPQCRHIRWQACLFCP